MNYNLLRRGTKGERADRRLHSSTDQTRKENTERRRRKEILWQSHLVIDADGHCNEPDVELAKWMPKELVHLAPNRVTDSSGYSHLVIESRLAARRRWGRGNDRRFFDF